MNILASSLVPPPDPFGLPAPAWLLLLLLNLTFVIHQVFMNFVLGGAVAQAVVLWMPPASATARALLRVLRVTWAVALSFTITTGVAPLLFVQVLYGQWFYPAGVLLGAAWLSIIALLLVAFYLGYALQSLLKRTQASRMAARGVAITIAVSVLMIAYLFTANNVLTVQPERWWDVQSGEQAAYVPHAPTFVPRYLLNLSQAAWVFALWIGWAIRWRRDLVSQESSDLAVLVRRLMLAGTTASIVCATWLYAATTSTLHAGGRAPGTAATMAWWAAVSILAAMALAAVMWAPHIATRRVLSQLSGLGLLALAGLVIGREGFRLAALATPGPAGTPTSPLDRFTVHPQYGAVFIFFALLLAGLALVALMLQWYRRGHADRTAS